MNINVRKLQNHEWQKFKHIRLEALDDSPTAFGQSAEDESKKTDEQWESGVKFTNENPPSLALFAEIGEEIIGMVGSFTKDREKMKHIANVWGMYVNSEYRGQGIGRKLLESLIEELKNHSQIKKIRIGVVSSNTLAAELYKRLGFEVVGEFKKELFVDSKYYDELLLEMYLD